MKTQNNALFKMSEQNLFLKWLLFKLKVGLQYFLGDEYSWF